jgi:hypothetical protein
VLQKSTAGHYWQSGGLIDDQQVAVIKDRLPLVGDGGLKPRRPLPEQLIAPLQHLLGLKGCAIQLAFTGLQPLRPGGPIGVLPALHQQLKGSLASFGWLHPMAVGPALVQRGLAPALHCS